MRSAAQHNEITRTRAIGIAGVAATLLGITLFAASDHPAYAATVTIAGVAALLTYEALCRLVPFEQVYKTGYDCGYEHGERAGRRSARPVVVPLRCPSCGEPVRVERPVKLASSGE